MRLTLPRKLFLVALSLLVIPAIGYRYVQEMDAYLRDAQEEQLLSRARIVAATLRERTALFGDTGAQASRADGPRHIYVRPLQGPVQLDGYAEDWAMHQDRRRHYAGEALLRGDARYSPESLSFDYRLGSYEGNLYALLEVTDDEVVYRSPNGERWDDGDHLILAMENPLGIVHHYVLGTISPGWVSVERLDAMGRVEQSEQRIRAEWQQTPDGYTVEVRIPADMLGERLGFAVVDVDDAETRDVRHVLGTADIYRPDGLSSVMIPAPELHNFLSHLERPASRIWLVDRERRVLALAGELNADAERERPTEPRPKLGDALHRLLFRLLLREPPTDFEDDLSGASRLSGPEVEAALAGTPQVGWRYSPDGRVGILTAAHPISAGDRVLGAVAVEQTSHDIRRLQNRAMEILINLGGLTFAVAAFALLAFGTRLSLRVRRLRNATEAAIAPDGRVRTTVTAAASGDELGDLQRSFATVLGRLSEYNRYLEGMAGKLNHELRTPVAVVHSSLDNLDAGGLASDQRRYVQRARDGVARLADILTRMSEATRLEQSLQSEQRETFDLRPLLEGCVEGYRLAYPGRDFRLRLQGPSPEPALRLHGVPELIAQMLDKLVANAHEFALPETPVLIQAFTRRDRVVLQVTNAGPPLPQSMRGRLFDSMVSVRPAGGPGAHLGLGLYIVRLIARFHGGEVRAEDRTRPPGVRLVVFLPLAE